MSKLWILLVIAITIAGCAVGPESNVYKENNQAPLEHAASEQESVTQDSAATTAEKAEENRSEQAAPKETAGELTEEITEESAEIEETAEETTTAPSNFPELLHPAQELWIIEKNGNHTDDRSESGLKTVGRKRISMLRSDISARIFGMIANVRMRQIYYNSMETTVDGIYTFPLPMGATITDFVLTVGNRNIRAMVVERGRARAIYKQAKAQGYRASLLSQRKNLFRQYVSNIRPGDKVEIRLEFFAPLKRHHDRRRFFIPATKNSSMRIELAAGSTVDQIRSNHQVYVRKTGEMALEIKVDKKSAVESYFELSYRVINKKPKAFLAIEKGRGLNKFALFLEPAAGQVIENLSIHWGLTRAKYNSPFPTQLSEPIVITGEIKGQPKIKIGGDYHGTSKTWTATPIADQTNVAKLWARDKIESLYILLSQRSSRQLKKKIIAISIEYNILSRYTSFIIVDTLKKAVIK